MSWTTSSADIATVIDEEDTKGLVTAVSSGSVTISATIDEQTASMTIDITEDSGVPTHSATSIAFTDTDANGSEIAGTVGITAASDESDVSNYVLYWGTDTATKQSATPITTVAKTGENLTYTVAADTSIPSSPVATHLLVFTSNEAGEMTAGVAVAIVDLGLPTNAAVSMSFTDTDTDGGEITGTVNITKAISEADVTHYELYWGSDTTTKQSATPITTIAVTGSDLTYSIPANTTVPSGPTATHLLVFTKNSEGEMTTGVSAATGDVGIPTNTAASVSFTDTDLDGDEVSGTVTITKAASESSVTHYVLYWGSDGTTKQNATEITSIAATGSNVTYTLAANTTIPTGPTASHLLVFTKNADGEMATGVNIAISDLTAPTNAAVSIAFTDSDTDGGQLAGTATITKAASEADLTHYVLYWGSDSSTKQNATPISSIAKTGANVTYTFAANTAIPSSPAATHLLVFTKNSDGEMATGVNLTITDVGIPTVTATSVAFTDTDSDSGEIGSDVTITKASSETNITHYVLYWGSDSSTKQSGTAIDTIAVTGSDVYRSGLDFRPERKFFATA